MEPTSSRPHMPGYGTLPASQGTGLLPWSWAEERLTRSHDYWVATVWPDGRPHISPVWGVWSGDALWFSASPRSRKARNLEHEPRASATTDDPLEPVVIEGTAERHHGTATIREFTDLVNAKYETDYTVDFFGDNALFRLVPAKAIGLLESDFTGSPTRWDLT